MRNVLREGALLSVQTPLPQGLSISQVVERCAEAADWRKAENSWQRPDDLDKLDWITPIDAKMPYLKRGIGFSCGFKNIGFSFGAPEECWATVELHGKAKIERVVIRHAASDVGQGSHTAIAQMVADAVGVPLEKVEMIYADTAQTNNSGSVSASRMTFMAGNAVRGASELALKKWQDEDRPAIGTFQYKPPRTSPYDPQTGQSFPNFAYGYMAQVAAVEVDMETGQVTLLNVIAVNDVGKAINPQQVEGQIEGAVVQAMGYSILEDFVQKDGYVLTPGLSTYLIPGILDIPEKVHTFILEYPEPIGPWGARGMAEMPFIPLAPAVIAAVHDATGIWFDQFPLTPVRVLTGLGKI
jgi:CO/xanthine dehydrogenase Mo-binding subunit